MIFEVIQYTGSNAGEVLDFIRARAPEAEIAVRPDGSIKLRLDSRQKFTICEGRYITYGTVNEAKHRFGVYKPEIFENIFVPCENDKEVV